MAMELTKSEKAFANYGIVTRTFESESPKPYQYSEFNSLNEFVESMKKIHVHPSKDGKAYNETYFDEPLETDSSCFGTEFNNYKKTIEAIERSETSKYIMDQVDDLRSVMLNQGNIRELIRMAETKKKRKVFRDTGSELDIDRVLSGDQDHWIKLMPGKKNSVVRLAVNIAISGAFGENAFYQVVSFGLVACELLESAGYNVEFYCLDINSNPTTGTKQAGQVILIKPANTPIDIQQVCLIGLPSIVRVFGFMNIEHVLDGDATMGYGSCLGIEDGFKQHLNMDFIIDNKTKNGDIEIFIGNLLNFDSYATEQ